MARKKVLPQNQADFRGIFGEFFSNQETNFAIAEKHFLCQIA